MVLKEKEQKVVEWGLLGGTHNVEVEVIKL